MKIVNREEVLEKKFDKYIISTGLDISKNNNKIEVGTVNFKPDSRIPGEGFGVHNFDELSYIIKGKINIRIENETIEVKKGDYIYIPKGEKHYSKNISKLDCIVLYIKLNN